MPESIIDQGRVTALDGDQAQVEILIGDACTTCGARILCKPGSNDMNTLTAYNQVQAQIGDRVEVRESGNLLLKLSFLQYAVPLLGFTAGIFIPYLIIGGQNELLLFLLGCLGCGLGACITWLGMRSLAGNPQHFLTITSIVK